MADGDEPEGGAVHTHDVVMRPGAGAGSYSQPLREAAARELAPLVPRRQTAVAVLDPWDRPRSPAPLGNRATAAIGTETGWRAAVSAIAAQLSAYRVIVPEVDPGRSIVEFENVEFSESEAYDRRQLLFYDLTAGAKATKALVDAFESSVEAEAWELGGDDPDNAVKAQMAVVHGRRVVAMQATRQALTGIMAERDGEEREVDR